MTQFNMTSAVSANLSADDEAAILASMFDDEIIEASGEEGEVTAIEAVAAEIEKAEAVEAMYADDEANHEEITEGDKPKTEDVAAPKKAKKAKKEKVAKEPKEPKEPKAERVRRQRGHESKVLLSRLGAKADEFLLLEVADAGLSGDDLKASQDAFCVTIDELADKVGQKATMLFSYMANGGKLNEVLQRTFAVLIRDGEITSGMKGNLQTDLLTKYSTGTSASQANQMMMLLPALKVTMKEKGKMVPNPDSLILMKMTAELSLS
jgi:hypothetical protein